jgi:hypothetical protein
LNCGAPYLSLVSFSYADGDSGRDRIDGLKVG